MSDKQSRNNSGERRVSGNISSLALLLPNNRPKQLCKGRSFVNLPPPSRIEQNALLFSNATPGAPLCSRVTSSEKFVNHMRTSPPPGVGHTGNVGQQQQDELLPSTLLATHHQRSSTRVRTAPFRHHSSQPRMSVPNPGQQSPSRMLQPDRPPLTMATTSSTPTQGRVGTNLAQMDGGEDEDGGGTEHVLLPDEGPRIGFGDPEDVEAGRVRPLRASIGGIGTSSSTGPTTQRQQQPLQDKASLKSSLKVEDTILRLNIGGSSYRIRTRSILKHGADTLLGRFVRMNEQHRRAWADAYFEEEDEYFFERVPRYFDPVYDFYASGKLHVPKDLCFDKFMAELRFWAVSKAKMDDCCSPFAQYCLYKKPHHLETPEKDHFIGLRCAKVRRRLWLILEGHSNSKWWKFFEITSTSFVVLSITALILASMPEFQVPDTSGSQLAMGPGTIYPTYPKVSGFTISTTTVIKDGEEHKVEMVEHPVFNYVENICVVYFTLEYAIRFWVAPQKMQFVKEFLNVIDLLAIAPFVFELILVFIGIRGDNVRKVRWAFLTVRLLRVLRVVRIAKLGRFSPGLANFALTLRKSKKQMQMVAIVLLTVIIFFSTLVYFMEKDEPNTTFTSIPAAFWWCLFSQTKWVPQTAAGKIVGGGAITCGVLVLALPIAILVNNFMQVVRLREEKLIKQYATIGTIASHQQSGGQTTTATGDRV